MIPITPNKLDALTGLRALAALAVFAQSTTRKFYFTRFARIWPLHVVCLLLIAFLTSNHQPPTDFPWARAWANWALLQAWYPASNWMGGYNMVAWSISAEAFFYLMFPILLLGTARQFWIKYACLFAATVGGVVWVASSFESASSLGAISNASLDPIKIVHFFPAFRLLEFMTGMAAGMVFLSRVHTRGAVAASSGSLWRTANATVLEISVLALSMSCFYLIKYGGLLAYFRGYGEAGITINRWLAMSGGLFFHAAVIYVFARSAGWASKFFGSPKMVFLGEISFAFYMIHLPVIHFVKQEFWSGTNFSIWYFAALTLVLTIGVSAWLYYLVEVPVKAALLKWYEGDFGIRQLLAEMLVKPVLRLAGTPMIFTLVLLLVVPVVVTKLYKRADRKSFTADQVLESVSPGFQPVLFGDCAELLAADVVPRRDTILINSVWRFSQPGTALITVHLSGTKHGSRQQTIVCSPETAGQPLFTKLIVNNGDCDPADAIDVSLTFDGQDVAPQNLQSEHAGLGPRRYRVFSREQIQEGLRVSRLPVLRR